MATRTEVHGCHKQHPARKTIGAAFAGNIYHPVFKRLAESIDYLDRKLRELI
jgi:hypothetical protein